MRPKRALALAVVLAVGALLASCADEASDGDAASTDASQGSTEPAAGSTTEAPDARAEDTSEGCGVEPPARPENGIVTGAIESSGGERAYAVYIPSGYSPDVAAPVAFTFHGAGSSKEEQLAYSAFAPMAEESGALVVAPDALGDPTRWSPYGSAATDRGGLEGVNDLEFFVDLLDRIEEDYCVDPGRVLVTGMSSGGWMSATIACEHSDLIAVTAPVTATAWSDAACAEAGPVPYVYFHGTDDPVVPFLGPIPGPDGEPGPGAAEVTAEQWAAHNGCDPEPADEPVGEEVVHRTWSGCDAPTDLYIVEGGGHTWPGGIDIPRLGHTTRDISASEIIWDLFTSTAPG
jgi:polyhydroxybutyrate depolymerase